MAKKLKTTKGKKQYSFEQRPGMIKLCKSYGSNFKKLFCANLLFLIPSGIIAGVLTWLSVITGDNLMLLAFLSIIFCMPFFGGLTKVTAELARGNRDINVFQTFKEALIGKGLRFLLIGVILYPLTIVSLYSFLLYYYMSEEMVTMYLFMGLCRIFIVIILFVAFYLCSLAVSTDKGMKYVFKNSFYLSFYKARYNYRTLLRLVLVIAIVALGEYLTSFNLVGNIVYWCVILLFLPALVSFVINFGVIDFIDRKINYDSGIKRGLEKMAQSPEEIEKQRTPEETQRVAENLQRIAESGNDDDYIFHNGKMVKRSVLIKELERQENLEDGR